MYFDPIESPDLCMFNSPYHTLVINSYLKCIIIPKTKSPHISGGLMSRRGSSSSKRRPALPPMPTAKELGELEHLKQNEVTLKTKIRSVRSRRVDSARSDRPLCVAY